MVWVFEIDCPHLTGVASKSELFYWDVLSLTGSVVILEPGLTHYHCANSVYCLLMMLARLTQNICSCLIIKPCPSNVAKVSGFLMLCFLVINVLRSVNHST